jgi:hypothetical protein
MVRLENKRRRKMKKSLLIWGVLVVIALCFVGCCYYTSNHNHCHPCPKHKHCCSEMGKKCPAPDDDAVETVTVEAVEIIPAGPINTPGTAAPAGNQKSAPAKAAPAQTSAAGQNSAGK